MNATPIQPAPSAITTCEICASATRSRMLGRSELTECTRCGHLERDLVKAPAFARDHAYGGDPSLDVARLALTHRTLQRACPTQPRRVFEVGFGSGAMLRRFLDDGSHVAGADPDQLQVAVDEKVRAVGELHACGVEQARVDPHSVDLVYGVHVLEHVVDPLETLLRCRSMLAPGGVAQFLTPAGDWAGLRLYSDGWWMLEDPTHIRFFTEESLTSVARAAGFVDVEVRRPVLDSLVNDAASARRALSRRERPAGILAERPTLALAALTAPAVIASRAVLPRLRPTLHLVARVA